MVAEQEMSVKLNSAMEIPPVIVKNFNKTDKFPVDMVLRVSNCEHFTFDRHGVIDTREKKVGVACGNDCHDHIVPNQGSNEDEDEEVIVVEDLNPIEERRMVERGLEDATESSSSFGCTDSEKENAETPSDEEAESICREGTDSLLRFDGFNDLFRTRKKKVSDHWRDFVRPLMWRCRWVELCVRELDSKASKYKKEIAENYERKQNESEKISTQELCMRSTSFICQNRHKVMKRRKRKRVEETSEIASYTSCHNLFSYYANRQPIGGSACKDFDRRHAGEKPAETDFFDATFAVNHEFPVFDFNKNNAFETILRKIEEAQSQVRQLNARMDKVFIENAEKFTSNTASSAAFDALASLHSVDGNSSYGKRLFVPESADGEGNLLHNMTKTSGYPGKCENILENNGFY